MTTDIEMSFIEKFRALRPDQQRRVADFVDSLTEASPSSHAGNARHIWEELTELSARVPTEVWQDVPVDGAEQHDHYLYGSPKRDR
jgi:hypothetical protein